MLTLRKYFSKIFKILVILILLMLLLNPVEVMDSAKEGLLLWYSKVLPSLFPFIVFINILVELNLFNNIDIVFKPIMKTLFGLPGKTAFVWLSGLLSGYPVGAKITVSLLEKKQITKKQAQHLLNFCNNSGPLFIIGTIGVGMLESSAIGYLLLFIHILSSLIIGILYRFVYRKSMTEIHTKIIHNKKKNIELDIGKILGNSIYNSMELMLQVCGFIVIFSVIMGLLKHYKIVMGLCYILSPLLSIFNIPVDTFQAFILGFIEITNGIKLITVTENISQLTLILISFLIAWSGFSIHAQTASIVKSSSLSMRKYLKAKLLQAIVAAILAFIIF